MPACWRTFRHLRTEETHFPPLVLICGGGIAAEAYAPMLPPDTRWVAIPGGSHSQFGRYGHQLLDGEATISREGQEAMTRTVLKDALAEAGGTG